MEKDIIAKLQQVQSELVVPKGQYNDFGKYNYRSCEDILEALKPVLANVGAIVTFNDEIVEVGGRVYVKSTVSFAIRGEALKSVAYAREPETQKGMNEAQITGSASSYARKYALNGLFAIDDTRDADTQDNSESEKKPSKPLPEKKPPTSQPQNGDKKITEGQKKLLYVKLKSAGMVEDDVKINFNVEHLSDLKMSDMNDILTFIESGKVEDEVPF